MHGQFSTQHCMCATGTTFASMTVVPLQGKGHASPSKGYFECEGVQNHLHGAIKLLLWSCLPQILQASLDIQKCCCQPMSAGEL